jgi:hypothetical protein
LFLAEAVRFSGKNLLPAADVTLKNKPLRLKPDLK